MARVTVLATVLTRPRHPSPPPSLLLPFHPFFLFPLISWLPLTVNAHIPHFLCGSRAPRFGWNVSPSSPSLFYFPSHCPSASLWTPLVVQDPSSITVNTNKSIYIWIVPPPSPRHMLGLQNRRHEGDLGEHKKLWHHHTGLFWRIICSSEITQILELHHAIRLNPGSFNWSTFVWKSAFFWKGAGGVDVLQSANQWQIRFNAMIKRLHRSDDNRHANVQPLTK